jgi:UDP-GlcNAc3NAcA epimerase
MHKKKIITIVGARPQFIKAGTLSRVFKGHKNLQEILVHTGQHYDEFMSDIFFEELHITKPQYSLNIHGGTHGEMTGRMLEKIDDVLKKEKPDAVLVYGDTNSTLAGSLSASKFHIPVIHIEAGLRSYNKSMPEEINRILTDHVSSFLFCPTKTAVSNLKKEGIVKNVYLAGDVMCDATLYAQQKIKNENSFSEKFSFLPKRFALMTVHREESTKSLEDFEAILKFSQNFSKTHNLKIIFPVHPRAKKILDLLSPLSKEVFISISPLSYFETQFLLSRSSYVLTDSGGLQKEAYFHRVPCVTLRSETEWVETIEAGWNRLWQQEEKKTNRTDISDYGKGKAAQEIIDIIDQNL